MKLEGFDAELPSKRFFFRDFTPQYVEARRVALDKYLQSILKNPDIYSSDFVWEFLKKRSERFQVAKNGDTVSSMVKHHFDNVVSVTLDATQTVGKGVGKVGNSIFKQTKERTKSARDLFSGGANVKGMRNPPQSTLGRQSHQTTDLQTAVTEALMEDEINLGMPGQRISPAYFSFEAEEYEAESEFGEDYVDVLGLRMPEGESISGSLYEFVDCIFRLQDRGFFRRQMFALYRRLIRLLFGSGIDEVAGDYIADVRQPATIANLIGKVQAILWPGGKFVKGQGHREEVSAENYLEPLEPPPEDYVLVKKRLHAALSDGPASALSKLVGRLAFFSGVDDLCAILSCQTMVTQISYGLLELVLEHLFEEEE